MGCGRGLMNSTLEDYLARSGWPRPKQDRMVAGLRALQGIARKGDQPITYAVFAELVQKGLAPLAAGAVLEDIGVFCNEEGWPNVTCFVVSATTGECSAGFSKISSEDPPVARDQAWFAYAVYKNAPLVDDE
jgi:hypothetical protein